MELNLKELPKQECVNNIREFVTGITKIMDNNEKVTFLPVDIVEKDARDKFELLDLGGVKMIKLPFHLFLVTRDLKDANTKLNHIVEFLSRVYTDFDTENISDKITVPFFFTNFDTLADFIAICRHLYLLEKMKFDSVEIVENELYTLKTEYENNKFIITADNGTLCNIDKMNIGESLAKFLIFKASMYLADNGLIKEC